MADNNNSGSTDGSLLKAPENMLHPRDYSAPSMDNAQTEGSGKGMILMQSEDDVFNNASQGSGIAGPAVWGGPSGMSGSKSSAESGSKQSNEYSVDLGSGQNSCWNGGNPRK